MAKYWIGSARFLFRPVDPTGKNKQKSGKAFTYDRCEEKSDAETVARGRAVDAMGNDYVCERTVSTDFRQVDVNGE